MRLHNKQYVDYGEPADREAEALIAEQNAEPQIGDSNYEYLKEVKVGEPLGNIPDTNGHAAEEFGNPERSRSKSNKHKAQANGGAGENAEEKQVELPPLTAEEWSNRDLPKEDLLIGHWMSTTSRVLLSADTGIGKTNFGMALAGHLGAGIDFLHWHIPRARRTVFIDGEMSALLLKDRIADVVRRLGCLPAEARFLSHEDVKDWQPLNTEAGQRYIHEMITQTAAEAVMFDNVMALILGDMRDEEAWRDTLPLLTQLTTRRVGQLWFHHTGHDASRSYGTKTREWRMDTVAQGVKIERPDTDVSFQLEFRKARGRRPETRHDFQSVDVALVDDKWLGNREQAAKTKRGDIPPVARKFFDALQNVFANGQTTKFQNWNAVIEDQWRDELLLQGLLDKDKPASQRSLLSKYRRILIAANYIACNNNLVWII